MAYTIEFDNKQAIASVNQVGTALDKVGSKASAAGAKAGREYSTALNNALKPQAISKKLQTALGKGEGLLKPDSLKANIDGGITAALEGYTKQLVQLKIANNSATKSIQDSIAVEKEKAAVMNASRNAVTSHIVGNAKLEASINSVGVAERASTEILKLRERVMAKQAKVDSLASDEGRKLTKTMKELDAQEKALTGTTQQQTVAVKNLIGGYAGLGNAAASTNAVLKGGSATGDSYLMGQTRQVKALARGYDTLKGSVASYNSQAKGGSAASITASLSGQKKQVDKLTNGYTHMASMSGKATKEQRKLAAAQNKATAATKVNSAAVAKNVKHINLAAQSTASWRAALSALGSHMGIFTSSTILAASAVYGLISALKGSVSIGTEFSGSMQRAFAVMGESGANAAQLNGFVRELGKNTVFTAKEVAEGLVFLGMAGQDMNEAMESLEPTLKLASIGMLDMAKAADIVTNIMGGFQLDAIDIKSVVDDMSTAVVSANMNIEQLGTSMSYVAPVAAAAGVGLEDVVASLEVLHNAGIKGSRAGTGLRRTIFNLFNTTTKGSAALKELGVVTTDVQGRARPLIDVLTELNTAGANLSQLGDIVGVRAAPAFIQLVKAAESANGELHKLRAELDDNAGAADNLQKEIEDFLGADVKKLTAAFQELGLVAFDAVEDDLRGLTEAATEFLKEVTLDDLERLADRLLFVGQALSGLAAIFIGKSIGKTMLSMGTFAAGAGVSMMGFAKSVDAAMKPTSKMSGALYLAGNNMSGVGSKSDKASKGVKSVGVAAGVANTKVGVFKTSLLGLVGGPLAFLATYVIGQGLISLIQFFSEVSTKADDASGSLQKFIDTDKGQATKGRIDNTKARLKDLKNQLGALQELEKSYQNLIRETPDSAGEFQSRLDSYKKEIATVRAEITSLTDLRKTQDKDAFDDQMKFIRAQKDAQLQLVSELQLKALKHKQALAENDPNDVTRDATAQGLKSLLEQIDAAYSEIQTLDDRMANMFASTSEQAGDLADPALQQVTESFEKQAKAIWDEHEAIMDSTTETEKYTKALNDFNDARAKFKALDLTSGAGRGSFRAAQDESGAAYDGSVLLDRLRTSQETLKSTRSSYLSEQKRAADQQDRIQKKFRKHVEDLAKNQVQSIDLQKDYSRIVGAEIDTRLAYQRQIEKLAKQEGPVSKAQLKRLDELKTDAKVAEENLKQANEQLKEFGKATAKPIEEANKRSLELFNKYAFESKALDQLETNISEINELYADPSVNMTLQERNELIGRQVRAIQLLNAKSKQSTTQQQILAGATHALEDYYDEVSNVYDEVNSLATDSLKGLEDVFVEFAQTGKFEFKDLIDDIEEQLIRLSTRKFVMQPLMDMFGLQDGRYLPGTSTGGGSGGGGGILDTLLGNSGSGLMGMMDSMSLSGQGITGVTAGSQQANMLLDQWGAADMAATSGVGDFFGSLFPFANGGEFDVGGSGGVDSQVVAFKASPNEQVTVRTPAQQDAEGESPIIIHNNITVSAPNGNISKQSLSQLQSAVGASIQRSMGRNR